MTGSREQRLPADHTASPLPVDMTPRWPGSAGAAIVSNALETAASTSKITTASSASALSATPASNPIRAAKRALRKSMASKLAQLSPSEVQSESEQITSQILRSPTFLGSHKISIYISMATGEVITDRLCRRTLELGKQLYVPLFASATSITAPTPSKESGSDVNAPAARMASDMRMMRIRDISELLALKANRWGIREPEDVLPSGEPREDALEPSTGGTGLDLILSPGVAFDSAAGRLGHGKGYYDRYITRCRAFERAHRSDPHAQGPVVAALALRAQLLEEGDRVPSDDGDVPLDAVLFAGGSIRNLAVEARWIDAEEGG